MQALAQSSRINICDTQDNLAVLALDKLLRSLPDDQQGFFKDCRIAAVTPSSLPRGDFKPNVHAMNMGKEQLDWSRPGPALKAVDDTDNNALTTGGKIISS